MKFSPFSSSNAKNWIIALVVHCGAMAMEQIVNEDGRKLFGSFANSAKVGSASVQGDLLFASAGEQSSDKWLTTYADLPCTSVIDPQRNKASKYPVDFIPKRIHQPSVDKCLAGTLGPQSIPHNKRTGFTQFNSMHCFVVVELIVHNDEVSQRVTCPHLALSNQSKPRPPKLNNSCLTPRIQPFVHSSFWGDNNLDTLCQVPPQWKIIQYSCFAKSFFSFVTRSLKTRTKMHKERPQKIA